MSLMRFQLRNRTSRSLDDGDFVVGQVVEFVKAADHEIADQAVEELSMCAEQSVKPIKQ